MNTPAPVLADDGDTLQTFGQLVEDNKRSNEYPNTEWQLRGLYKNREALGISDAFSQGKHQPLLVWRRRLKAGLGKRSGS